MFDTPSTDGHQQVADQPEAPLHQRNDLSAADSPEWLTLTEAVDWIVLRGAASNTDVQGGVRLDLERAFKIKADPSIEKLTLNGHDTEVNLTAKLRSAGVRATGLDPKSGDRRDITSDEWRDMRLTEAGREIVTEPELRSKIEPRSFKDVRLHRDDLVKHYPPLPPPPPPPPPTRAELAARAAAWMKNTADDTAARGTRVNREPTIKDCMRDTGCTWPDALAAMKAEENRPGRIWKFDPRGAAAKS